MSDTQEASVFPIKQVENMRNWFAVSRQGNSMIVNVVGISQPSYDFLSHVTIPVHSSDESDGLVEVLRYLYNLKVGEVGCYWGCSHTLAYKTETRELMEFRYANIKFGDLFDFYTSADGVLRLPNWKHIKHAMDEYLAEDPRLKFHPSRVQQFIDENGLEKLEIMD